MQNQSINLPIITILDVEFPGFIHYSQSIISYKYCKMIEPKRLGRFLQVDNHGFIVPDVSLASIQPHWRPLVDHATKKLMAIPGVTAVYIRGSIPRGLVQDGYSDADFLCPTNSNDCRIGTEVEALDHELQSLFPQCRGLEVVNLTPQKLAHTNEYQTRPYQHMMLKTQALCLAGHDICINIAPYKPDVEMVSHAFHLERDFAEYLKWQTEEGANIAEVRRWLSRRIVRAGLEITLNRQSRFTRDLYLCYEVFTEFYPQHQQTMSTILQNALNGHLPLEPYQDFISLLQAKASHLLRG